MTNDPLTADFISGQPLSRFAGDDKPAELLCPETLGDNPSTTPGTLQRDQDDDKIAFPTGSEKLQELSPTEARLSQYCAQCARRQIVPM
jgi:hypothetical protein